MSAHKLSDFRGELQSQKENAGLVLVDDSTRVRLQNALLAMYKDILAVCDNLGITPYLIGGSALGAVRHQGFIPWDDDLDIGMTREDHSIFVSAFEERLGDRYTINAPNLSEKPKCRFTKIFKKGTVCREITDPPEALNGIFLDIFIIENVPRNKALRTIKGMWCNALQFISTQVFMYENREQVLQFSQGNTQRSSIGKRLKIGKLFSFRSSGKWFNAVDKAVRYRKTGLYGIATGRKHYLGEIFEEQVFFPKQYLPFCDIQAPVFNDYDPYLKNLYGDYMTLPPEEKRERHYLVELKF